MGIEKTAFSPASTFAAILIGVASGALGGFIQAQATKQAVDDQITATHDQWLKDKKASAYSAARRELDACFEQIDGRKADDCRPRVWAVLADVDLYGTKTVRVASWRVADTLTQYQQNLNPRSNCTVRKAMNEAINLMQDDLGVLGGHDSPTCES